MGQGQVLEIAPTLLTVPLFTELSAGSAHEGHRHSTAHGTDLFGVGGFAVGTDDTFAAGEVLLLLAGGLLCFGFMCCFQTRHLLTMSFAFTFYHTGIIKVSEIVIIPVQKFSIDYFIVTSFVFKLFIKFFKILISVIRKILIFNY